MDAKLKEAANLSDKSYQPTCETKFVYGTSGFRAKSDTLHHIAFRSGLLAALRSKAANGTVGLMITASHNPACDNGVKIIDPLGGMMDMSWEEHASNIANAKSDLDLLLSELIQSENINWSNAATVAVARDTRSSGEVLSDAVIAGCEVLGAKVINYGLLTTPQLHFCVRASNDFTYGTPSEAGYCDKLIKAFEALNSHCVSRNYLAKLSVDCANGIGALKLKEFSQRLLPYIDISILNDGSGVLNDRCGADFVKVSQCHPSGVVPKSCTAFASFDGDADRIVYFLFDSDDSFRLIDGDKIACLFVMFLLDLVKSTGLTLNIGVVQTAYANGRSTQFLKDNLGVEVACVDTGVKYLHKKAQDFDIGVYFEANGHGTVCVLFSQKATEDILSAVNAPSLTEDQRKSAHLLKQTMDLINQTVGDAISDLLLIETILRRRDQTHRQWLNLYQDFPNRQIKVKVKDRSIVTTTDAARRVVTPEGLQALIDEQVSHFSNGRCFVRASGTENILRVYAEADSQKNADNLARSVADLVYDKCGGIGEQPSIN